jgi:PAS domain S-box-containing protein
MMKEDIEQRQAILAAIIDSSEDAIISKTLDGIITSWNKSAERMFEYKESEIVGKHIYTLIPLDRRAEEDMIISNMRAGRRIEHYRTVRLTKSGRELHISLTVSPIKNSKGIIVGASKIARDITSQKLAEDLINRYTQQLELINATGKSIAAEMNVDNILQKVTAATTRLSGAALGAFFYHQKDASGEASIVYAFSGGAREAFDKMGMFRNNEIFQRTFNGEGVLRSDNLANDPRYGKKTPDDRPPEEPLPVVSYLAVPVISPTGTVVGGLFFGHPKPGVFREEHESLVVAIAGQAAVALDKARLYEEVHAMNAKKDEFISFASHELKTPLTTINGYLQLVEQSPEVTDEVIPKIRKQVNRLSDIINDLLDISKIQAGKLELNFTNTNLPVLIRESVETVRTMYPHRVIDSEVPSDNITLMIDSQKISQVLLNLLTNAAKYSKADSKITVTAMRIDQQIRIGIQDRGVGIAPEHINNIFSRFYRITETSQNAPGLGLGLYLSKAIMEAHGGKIWVDSVVGKGSTFFIEFPVSGNEFL